MGWDILSFELRIVIGIFLGLSTAICICGYKCLKYGRDLDIQLQPIDESSEGDQIEMKSLEEMPSVCACKPGDYPRCLPEN